MLVGVLLVAAAGAARGEELDPKARKLADEGIALCKVAHGFWKKLVLEEPKGDERLALVEEIVDRYDAGLAKLEQALDVQGHAGLRQQLALISRQAFRMRAHLFWLRENRKLRQRPRPKPRQGEATQPEPNPETQPPEARPPDPDEVAAETAEQVSFAAGRPPAVPVAVDVDAPAAPEDEEADRARRRDERRIRVVLRRWLQGRKKLHARHALCRGEGEFSDGTKCAECAGTGRLVNQHEFREAFWAVYSPVLRGADGAWEALGRFREAATRDPALLGPLVKSFSVRSIDHRGLWAKAKVRVRTDEGRETIEVTLISAGRAWYLYCPRTDGALLGGRE